MFIALDCCNSFLINWLVLVYKWNEVVCVQLSSLIMWKNILLLDSYFAQMCCQTEGSMLLLYKSWGADDTKLLVKIHELLISCMEKETSTYTYAHTYHRAIENCSIIILVVGVNGGASLNKTCFRITVFSLDMNSFL